MSACALITLGTAMIVGGAVAHASFAKYTKSIVRDSDGARYRALDTTLTTARFGMSYTTDDLPRDAFTYSEDQLATYVDEKYDGVKSYYRVQLHDGQAALEGQKWNVGDDHGSGHLNRLASVNKELVSDYLMNGYTFDDQYDGKVPVILPWQFLEDTEGRWLYEESAQNNYEFFKYAIDKYVGKSYRLMASKIDEGKFGDMEAEKYKSTGVEVIVVGIVPRNFLNYSELMSTLLVPDWTVTKVPALDFMNKYGKSSVVVEFATQQERAKAVKAATLDGRFQLLSPLRGAVAELSERYANIRDSLLLTGAMLLMISFVVLLAIEGTLITKVILGDVALVLGTILGIGTVAVLASIFKSEIFYNVAQYADFSKYAPYPALAYVDLPYITILITAFVVSGVSTVAGLVGKKAK